MSTQDWTEIPFSISHQQQSFKLLELPPELLAFLESANPPTLVLKSSSPGASASEGEGYALLCSPEKTYRIQQKNSSNPIMILRPSISASEDDAIPRPSLCSIAMIEDTLELLPEEIEVAAAPAKVNKWHEKFAASRAPNKPKD